MDTIDQSLSLIGQYGYLVILLGVMLESAGVPIPGETILITSGLLVQQGSLDLRDVVAFGILGAVVGDQTGYWIGRRGGRPFVLRWGRYVWVTPERLGRAERFFERHGGKAVFLARFVAGLRVFGALAAGISRMHWRTFFFYNALGGAVWATVSVLVGYLLGGSLDLVEAWMGRATTLLAIMLTVGVVLYLLSTWVRIHPERLSRAYERTGGRYMRTFLQSPNGLWLKRRFSPGEVYGLALTVGLLFTGLFSWAFGSLVEDVVSQAPLVQADLALLNFVYANGDPTLTTGVVVFEAMFSLETLLLVSAVVGALFTFVGWRRRQFSKLFSGGMLLAAAFGAGALIEFFKFLFDRPHPPASLQLVPDPGLGFPSGHAMAALVVGAAALYLWSLRSTESWGGSWRAKVRVGLIVVALVLLIGFGRVYMGAHYPSDILAGWALGGVWGSICLTAAEVYRRLQESKSGDRSR